MTPVVRVICLVAFAGCIAHAGFSGLALGWALLVLVSMWIDGNPWSGVGVLLRRIRWLVVSLILIYGWFTPGSYIVPVLGPLSPSISGLYEGTLRIAALLAMVAAVHLLLKATTREQLISALHQLTRPLEQLRFPRERFVARMALVLDSVPKVQELVRLQVAQVSNTGPLWRRMAAITAVVFSSVLAEAEQQPTETVTFSPAMPVSWYQWLYPIALMALFQWLR